MTRTNKFTYTLVRLPSTVLHELLHALMVIIFTFTDILFNILRSAFGIKKKEVCRIENFNIFPNFKEGTLGSVSYIFSSGFQDIFINIAPIFSLIILFVYLDYFGYIVVDFHSKKLIEIPDYNFKLVDIFTPFIAYYLLSASLLSKRDLSNMLKGLLKVDTLMKLAILSSFIYLIVRYNLDSNANIVDYLKELFGIIIDGLFEIIDFIRANV